MALPLNDPADWGWINLIEPRLNTSDTSSPQDDRYGVLQENEWSGESGTLDMNEFFNLSPAGSIVPDETDRPAAAVEEPQNAPLTHGYSGESDRQQMNEDLHPAGKDAEEDNGWESRYHTDDFGSKYNFRSSAPGFRQTFNSTWIDTDRSGNYDPSEESRQIYAPRKRARLMQERSYKSEADASGGWEGSGDGGEDIELKRKRSELADLLVRLRFGSEQAQTAFCNLTASLAQKRAVLPSTAPEHEDFTQGYRLRTRQKDGTLINDAAYPAQYLSVDLTGHPAARGCHNCLKLNFTCSLLEDEFKWPCDACEEVDDECPLITEPKVKRACERCRKKRWRCSFSRSLDHRGSCDKCKADGYYCVAGPAKHALNKRSRYGDVLGDTSKLSESLERDQVPDDAVEAVHSVVTPPFSPDEVGAACATASSTAPTVQEETLFVEDLKTSTGTEVKEVQTSPEQHTQEHAISALSKSISNGKARDRPFSAPFTSPIPRQAPRKDNHQPQANRIGVTKQITTKFCHPIIFNHQPNMTSNGEVEDPCHFCDSPFYAILGLGAKTVKVIDWSDGQGLQEIRGGHQSDGMQNTRICTSCTAARLQIIKCKPHNMRPIPGVEDVQLDLGTELDKLREGRSERAWCSVCPAPGRYECCAEGLGSDYKGCGLDLCDSCHNMLLGHYAGNLQRMLKSVKSEPTPRRPLGLRADCELLLEQGVLVRYAMQASNRGQ